MLDLAEKLRGWLRGTGRRGEAENADLAVENTPGKRKTLFPWLALLLGLTGILLLCMGDCAQPQTANSAEPETEDLAESVVRLAAAISGDPKPVVALTYVRNEEYLYAIDERQTSAGSEREVVRYENESGREQGLLQTTRAPEVAGVAIVCRNGTDASVCLRLTEAVATALRLRADQVYVTAKSAD